MSTICLPAIAAPATVGREAWGESGEKHLPPERWVKIGRVRLRRTLTSSQSIWGSTESHPTTLKLSGHQLVEIPQNNYAKAVTRIRAVFQLEPAAMQCVAIEMAARSVTLVTLQITVGGYAGGQKVRIMNYERKSGNQSVEICAGLWRVGLSWLFPVYRMFCGQELLVPNAY